MQFINKQSEKSENEASNSKSLLKSSDQLVFISGQTNPLLFVNVFEKCRDLKTDKDKMFKIRNFVDASHRGKKIYIQVFCHFLAILFFIVEFSELYFTSDWKSVRQAFIKKYASSYTENKKKELSIDFNLETSLRSFIERKLKGLSSYTTLPLFNQIEMVLVDLPNSISKLFLVNEIMTSSKAEILDFCDSIQDLVQTMWEKTENEPPGIQEPLNEMEIFTFDAELDSQSKSMPSIRRSGSGSANPVSGRKRGRPRKNQSTLLDVSESSVLNDSSQSWLSSSENMSVDGSPQAIRAETSRGSIGRIAKRARGRPRKNMNTITEESTDSVAEYLNEISDSSSATSRRSETY